MLADEQVRHVMYHMTLEALQTTHRLDAKEFALAPTQPGFIGVNRAFYAALDGYLFGDWNSLLKHS